MSHSFSDTKRKAISVASKLSHAAETRVSLNEKREVYRAIARRGSVLYFAIADLAAVNPMYQVCNLRTVPRIDATVVCACVTTLLAYDCMLTYPLCVVHPADLAAASPCLVSTCAAHRRKVCTSAASNNQHSYHRHQIDGDVRDVGLVRAPQTVLQGHGLTQAVVGGWPDPPGVGVCSAARRWGHACHRGGTTSATLLVTAGALSCLSLGTGVVCLLAARIQLS